MYQILAGDQFLGSWIHAPRISGGTTGQVRHFARFGLVVAQAIQSLTGLDVDNALNVDTVLTEINSYNTWRQPLSIIRARFAQVSARFDF